MNFCSITNKQCNADFCVGCEIWKKRTNGEDEIIEDTVKTKTMRDISTELQTHCHDGESNRKVKIRVLDAYYNIGSIKKVVAGDETYFVIETEV